MNNQSTTRNNPIYRSGFSIIEVLTSIVVAMIGVFGVMVLIPFAVKQAQTGLDSDAATVAARNAHDQLEIAGYRNRETWVVTGFPGSPPLVTVADAEKYYDETAITSGNTPPGPQPYSIDPLGILEQIAGPDYTNTGFPFNHMNANAGNPFPPSLFIKPANLRLPIVTPTPMRKSDARRMFRAADDLVFGDSDVGTLGTDSEDAALNGPEQIFDRDGVSGNTLKRQSVGKISWSAIVVPENSSASNYKMYVLVYKNRSTELTIDGPEFNMMTAQVALPNTLAAPVSTIQLEPGFEITDGAVRKEDWVMLTNRRGPAGIDQQIAFYRVVNFDPGSVADNLPVQLTLDGPDFNFDPNPPNNYGPTYVVHLKNVVGVYERTFSPEGNSIWNIAF